jgi:hypothetical protein
VIEGAIGVAERALRVIFLMSLAGSAVAAAIFALKPLAGNRLPKAARHYLWLVLWAFWQAVVCCWRKKRLPAAEKEGSMQTHGAFGVCLVFQGNAHEEKPPRIAGIFASAP